jgi:methyl acetate hydrolase
MWNQQAARFLRVAGLPPVRSGKLVSLNAPLAFDPGERWEYGIGMDMVGRIVEEVSGLDLETYMREHIFAPLGMTDTSYVVRPEWSGRVARLHVRTADGGLALVAQPPGPVAEREFFTGGGGLLSTAPDYMRFLRALLRGGELDGRRILRPETVALMGTSQIGALEPRSLVTQDPYLTNSFDMMPGIRKGWGLSFLINAEPLPQGRGAGSLAWAGLNNTYFWLDPAAQIAGVFMAQLLPFADRGALDAFEAFERAVYR